MNEPSQMRIIYSTPRMSSEMVMWKPSAIFLRFERRTLRRPTSMLA